MAEDTKPARTPQQREALREAYKLLAAQFDDVLIVCSNRADHRVVATDLPVFFKGGWLMARSLADYAHEHVSATRGDKREPN